MSDLNGILLSLSVRVSITLWTRLTTCVCVNSTLIAGVFLAFASRYGDVDDCGGEPASTEGGGRCRC